MSYGVPYKGSKNKIAKWVAENLPEATNFYDLFAGGCAITHCALLGGKYQNYYANDIWTAPKLFLDAINGKYANETRWISREEFLEKRLADPYIQFCWSFGNDGSSYIYGRKIEPYKKACHYAIVFDDWREFNSLCPEVADAAESALENVADIHQRRIRFGPAVVRRLKAMGDASVFGKNPLYSSCRTKKPNKTRPVGTIRDLESLESLESLERLQSLESLESLGRLGRLQSLESLARLQSLESLQVSQGSYEDVAIKPGSVIYCDIPYRNASGYKFNSNKKSDKNSFDYEAFYSWCGKQKELVIVSEYSAPEDFICVKQIEKTVTNCATATLKATERLFVPKHQIELYREMTGGGGASSQLEIDFLCA